MHVRSGCPLYAGKGGTREASLRLGQWAVITAGPPERRSLGSGSVSRSVLLLLPQPFGLALMRADARHPLPWAQRRRRTPGALRKHSEHALSRAPRRQQRPGKKKKEVGGVSRALNKCVCVADY